MPAVAEYVEQTSSNVTLTTTSETVVVTVSGVSLPRAGLTVSIEAWCQVTTGTGTTALTPRIRRGAAITDPLVGEANAEQVEAAAGSTEGLDVMVRETPGELAGASYSLTVQQTAATADGTVLQAGIRVRVVG